MREKGEQLLRAWAQDYATAKRGESSVLVDGAAADGRVYLYGLRNSACAAVYVHPSGAVAPILAGAHDRCLDACHAAQDGEIDVADCRRCPLPTVRIDGIDRQFRQVTGRRVVGVIEHGESVLLLGFVGSCWAVACLEAERAEWLATSGRIGLVDLDLWRELHAPLPVAPEPQAPAGPPPSMPASSPVHPPPQAPAPPPTSVRPEPPAPAPPTASSAPPPAPQALVPPSPPAPSTARPEPPAPRPPPPAAPPASPAASPTPSPPPAAPSPAPPPDPETLAILQLHKRLLGIDVGTEKAALGRVLLRGLEIHVGRVPPGRRRELLEALARGIVALGSRVLYEDPRGTKSQLASSFGQSLGQPVSAHELGEALVAARFEGWDFITLTERTWTIHLGELLDIRSPLHMRFVQRCIPTVDLRGVEQVDDPSQATAANEPPSGVDQRQVQTLLVAVVMLASAGMKHSRAERVTAQDERLAAEQADLEEARARLADRDAQLADRDAQLAAMRSVVQTERDLDPQHVTAPTDGAEARMDLALRDGQLVEVQREQADHDGQPAEMRSAQGDHDAQRAALQDQLGRARTDLTDRNMRLTEALAERDEARHTLATRDVELIALQAERDEARRLLAERDAEVASLRRELTLQAEQSSRLEARIVRLESTRSLFAPWSAVPGDLHAARTSLSAQASALPHPTPSGSTTPRGGRGPPGGTGPR